MERLLAKQVDLKELSPLALAFIGDAVYSLLVREDFVTASNRPAGALHRMSVGMVNAPAQAGAFKAIEDMLTEEEKDVYRRGRNAHTPRAAKGASLAEYHSATGLEALFGYLYLKNERDRIKELFCMITAAQPGNTVNE